MLHGVLYSPSLLSLPRELLVVFVLVILSSCEVNRAFSPPSFPYPLSSTVFLKSIFIHREISHTRNINKYLRKHLIY